MIQNFNEISTIFFSSFISEQKSPSELKKELISLGKLKGEYHVEHKCNICPKVFKSTTHLKRHLAMHQNLRNISCVVCGSTMNSNAHLSTHIWKVHKKNSNFPCILCSIKFSTMQEWQAHKTSVHPETMKKDNGDL